MLWPQLLKHYQRQVCRWNLVGLRWAHICMAFNRKLGHRPQPLPTANTAAYNNWIAFHD
jgi:hypothetical protein